MPASMCKILHVDGQVSIELCADEQGNISLIRRLAVERHDRITDQISIGNITPKGIEEARSFLTTIHEVMASPDPVGTIRETGKDAA